MFLEKLRKAANAAPNMTIKHLRCRNVRNTSERCSNGNRKSFVAKKRRIATRPIRCGAPGACMVTVYDVERGGRYDINGASYDEIQRLLANTASDDACIDPACVGVEYASNVVDLACFNRYVSKINAEYDSNEKTRERFLPFSNLLHPGSAVARRATICTEYDNFTLTAVCFSIASTVAPENSELDYYRYMRAVLQCEMPIEHVPSVLHAPLAHIIKSLGGTVAVSADIDVDMDADAAAMIRNTFEVFRPMRTILRCFYDVYVPAYTSDWFLVLHHVTPVTNYEFIQMLDSHADLKHEALVFQREQAEKRANTVNYMAYELLHTSHYEAIEIAATFDYFRNQSHHSNLLAHDVRTSVFTFYDHAMQKRRVFLWTSDLNVARINLSVTLPYMINAVPNMSVTRISPTPLYPTLFSFLTMGSMHHRAGALRALYILSIDDVLPSACETAFAQIPTVNNPQHVYTTVQMLVNILSMYGAQDNIVASLYETPCYRGVACVVQMILRRYASYYIRQVDYADLCAMADMSTYGALFDTFDKTRRSTTRGTLHDDPIEYFEIPPGVHYDFLDVIVKAYHADRTHASRLVEIVDNMGAASTSRIKNGTYREKYERSMLRVKHEIANIDRDVTSDRALVTDHVRKISDGEPGSFNGVTLPADHTRMTNLLCYIRETEQLACRPANTRYTQQPLHIAQRLFFTASTEELLSTSALYEYPIEFDAKTKKPIYLSTVLPLINMSCYHHHRQGPFNNAHPDMLIALICEPIVCKIPTL